MNIHVNDVVDKMIYDPRKDITQIFWKDGTREIRNGRLYNSVTKEPIPCIIGTVRRTKEADP